MTFSSLYKASCGFTLVELSIVLIIIGLLAGGILASKNLFRIVHLNKIAQNKQQIDTVTTTFYGRFDSLPGDMRDATTFFDDVVNGNGDFVVDYGGATIPGQSRENLQFWRHLAKAGLIDGDYAGVILDEWNAIGPGGNLYEIAPETATYLVSLTMYDHTHWYVISGLHTNSSGKSYVTNGGDLPPISLSQEELWEFDKNTTMARIIPARFSPPLSGVAAVMTAIPSGNRANAACWAGCRNGKATPLTGKLRRRISLFSSPARA